MAGRQQQNFPQMNNDIRRNLFRSQPARRPANPSTATGTHDGNSVTAAAGVALEDDIAALVDGQAVVLVRNHALQKLAICHQNKHENLTCSQ